MAAKNDIISQCLNLVNQIVEKKLSVYMNLQMGEGISFVFDNMTKKSKSPSNKQRNIERSIKFKQKIEKHEDEEILDKAQQKKEMKQEKMENSEKFDTTANETSDVVCESIMLDRPTVFESDMKVEKDLMEHFEVKGIKIKKVIFVRDASRDLRRIEIKIKPMKKKFLEDANIKFRDCRILWMR